VTGGADDTWMIQCAIVGMSNKAVLHQTSSSTFRSQFSGIAVTTDDVEQQVSEQQDEHEA